MIKELEKKISPVLVVNNSSLKPYVELFEYSPENIYQQPLGSLVGFFEIKEYSQDSAYIVNFLTSVLKKEYYINPKRPVAESLDCSLHKVNLALSELAKQGNVEWLGKLNAAICVLEKNNTHFSVAGSAKIFLYRNNMLSNISDGLAFDSPEPHPLKTFVNVSSGRLEKNDRLLITPEDIFHIFSTNDIRKNLQRFTGEKFVQFLKTALSNQLEMISAIIVDVTEVKSVSEVKMSTSSKKSEAVANVFSEKTFAKTPKQNATLEENPEDVINYEEIGHEYIDKKTGHIYVQGGDDDLEKNSQANMYWDMTKEKISQGWYSTKNDIRRRFSIYKKQLAKKGALRKAEKEKQKTERWRRRRSRPFSRRQSALTFSLPSQRGARSRWCHSGPSLRNGRARATSGGPLLRGEKNDDGPSKRFSLSFSRSTFTSLLLLPSLSLPQQHNQARLPGRGAPPPPPGHRDPQPGRHPLPAAPEAPGRHPVGAADRPAGLVPGRAADALADDPELERCFELFECFSIVAATHVGGPDLGARVLPERAVVGPEERHLKARAGGGRGGGGAEGGREQRPEQQRRRRRRFCRRRRRPFSPLDLRLLRGGPLLPDPAGPVPGARERQRGAAPELAGRRGGVR